MKKRGKLIEIYQMKKIADEFSVNFIKNNTLKIWSIMNEITEEKAKEEFEFWSE